MANDIRDAEIDLLIDIQKIIGPDRPHDGVSLARYIESREAELRAEIADRLEDICADYGKTMPDFIDELRGNK